MKEKQDCPEKCAGRYRNVFAGEIMRLRQKDDEQGIALQNILSAYPVAMLERLEMPPSVLPCKGEI